MTQHKPPSVAPIVESLIEAFREFPCAEASVHERGGNLLRYGEFLRFEDKTYPMFLTDQTIRSPSGCRRFSSAVQTHVNEGQERSGLFFPAIEIDMRFRFGRFRKAHRLMYNASPAGHVLRLQRLVYVGRRLDSFSNLPCRNWQETILAWRDEAALDIVCATEEDLEEERASGKSFHEILEIMSSTATRFRMVDLL